MAGRVYLAGTSSGSIPYRRLLWKGFTEDFYLDAFFLKPLADRLQLDRGVLRMIYAQTVDEKGWSSGVEMVLGYEG